MVDPTQEPTESTRLRPSRVVYVAPESTAGGVGHYSDVFVAELRRQIDDVIEFRHPGPGTDTVATLRRRHREILAAVDVPGRVALHAELSGGSVESFWPTAFVERRAPSVVSTATVHDPPGVVWLPGRTRLLSKSRVASHALHYPGRPITRAVERRVIGDRSMFALTHAGAEALGAAFPRATVHHVPLLVLDRPEIAPAHERPRAVGMFGLVYRGKGFEHISRIRAALDPSIALRVAGRGTEALPPVDGVEILGGLDGSDLDDFFASVRTLLVPYGQRTLYGPVFPASSVAAHAIAYLTPLVSTAHGALAEMADDGGAVVVGGPDDDSDPIPALSAAAQSLVDDDARLRRLVDELTVVRADRSPRNVVDRFVDVWSR
ncbi:glycosyltransferase [Williamsia sp. M5A3_1d]